jgi:hypothetical protein
MGNPGQGLIDPQTEPAAQPKLDQRMTRDAQLPPFRGISHFRSGRARPTRGAIRPAEIAELQRLARRQWRMP